MPDNDDFAGSNSPMRGILLKIASVVVFLCMSTCIKAVGSGIATGQITFFRSAFAMVPILAYLAWTGDLTTAFATKNIPGHLARGFIGIIAMSFGFYGLVHLPLPEAIAIGYAMPLIAVIFAAVFLKETVRLYRWTAVLVGLAGVLIISWPRLTLLEKGTLGLGEASGALAVIISAALGASAMILVRKLVQTEKTHTIVLYFSLSASFFSLATVPFGWSAMSWTDAILLIASGFCGGVAQILLTESYRHADVSTVAPFEYTSIILGLIIAWYMFGEVPTVMMLIGTSIVVASGIFIIYRERKLGLKRRAARRVITPQG
jgi:drug/metabolite transporter (DMT)-like permease